jgi:hypothetical protein
MWLYVECILIPHQKSEAEARDIPRGNLSDLYPRWLGARELLLHGRDPYGEDVTREVQIGYYGRQLDHSRPNDPKDEQGFAYPVYVVFIIAPTVKLSFSIVQPAFTWTLWLLTAVSAPIWVAALRLRASVSTKLTWVLVSLGCFPAVQGIKLQQLSLLIAFFLAGSIYAASRRHFALSGMLLALSTIKPQLVLLLVGALFLWASAKWHVRQRLVWSFLIALGALSSAGEFVLRGWIHEFWAAMASYYRYTGGGKSILDVLLGPAVGRLLSLLVVAIVLFFSWKLRLVDEETPEFSYLISLTLSATLLVIPMFAPYNQLLLLPALMLSLDRIKDLWNRGMGSRACVLMAAWSVLWPFLAATALVGGLLFFPVQQLQQRWAIPLYTNFAIPIAVWAVLLVSGQILLRREGEPRADRPDTLRAGAATE